MDDPSRTVAPASDSSKAQARAAGEIHLLNAASGSGLEGLCRDGLARWRPARDCQWRPTRDLGEVDRDCDREGLGDSDESRGRHRDLLVPPPPP